MDRGSPAGEVADGRRDLVFVSYSHGDAEWVQRLGVLLRPLVRSKQMQLWSDTAIQVGNAWHPELIGAIDRSSVALLLVSKNYLNSDFIMGQELPALIARGVRLAPVLVGPCLWKGIPELARVQWLYDPGRDGALNLVPDQPDGQRDQRLVEICNRLIALVPDARGDLAGPPAIVDASPVDAVETGSERGKLHGVPALPPGYLAREELAALIAAVVAVDGGAVGLTGKVSPIGLHGQGGIGKSVLAVALARDEGIGRRFPDGVYWVDVGDKADVLAVQLDLLARLGGQVQALPTLAEALSQLTELLRDRRILLVVDDVWSDAAAHALRATGPRGRVLYTSRDPQVLSAVGARLQQVDVLSPAAARALAAGVLDIAPELLPAAADRAFADVGRVALAIALIAAAVRGGQSWGDVAGALVRDARVFGDHPYADTFKAMQIATGVLPTELAAALLGMAVFPPDIHIPVVAIERYWAHTSGRTAEETACDLRILAAANVLRLDQDTVGFHDLLHDYLLLHAPTLALLHAGLLDAYRALLPADGSDEWWRLPPGEPYIWDHLVAHLRGAGDRRVLAATVTDPAYLVQRIDVGGPRAAEADLTRAATALPAQDLIPWWRDWIGRHAHLLVSGERTNGDVSTGQAVLAPTMLAWLKAGGSMPEGVDPDRLAPLLPYPYLTVRWGLTPPATALVRILIGPIGGMWAVAWSADGTLLAAAGGNEEVRLWNPITGRHLFTATYTDNVRAVIWSPDGMRLATASDNGQVQLWDPVNGWHLSTLTAHSGKVHNVAWSSDGTRLATGSDNGEVLLWVLSLSASAAPLTDHIGCVGHGGKICAVAWSPDGTRLATGDENGRVLLWDTTTGQQLATFICGEFLVAAVAWSPDGIRLATTGDNGQVLLWDTTTGQQLATFTCDDFLTLAITWSPDGTRLASAGLSGQVQLWDPTTGQQVATFIGHAISVRAMAWSPDGIRLASTGDDGQVRLWSTIQPQLSTVTRDEAGYVSKVAWSPDGTRLASSAGSEVRLWAPRTGQQMPISTQRVFQRGSAMVWSPDGIRMVTVNYDGTVVLWDPLNDRRLSILTSRTGKVGTVNCSPDGTRLASIDDNGEVGLWDPINGRRLSTLASRTGKVGTVTWSSDGARLATIGDNGEVGLWDPVNGRRLSTLTAHIGKVREVNWSPNGKRLAVVCAKGQVVLWDSTTGWQMSTINRPAIAVAWSPDGARLATAGGIDGEVRLWDFPTDDRRWWRRFSSRRLSTVIGHTGWVRAMTWSPDGTHLAAFSSEGRIYTLDVGRAGCQTYLRVGLNLTCLHWASGGIAVSGLDGVVVLDLVDPQRQTSTVIDGNTTAVTSSVGPRVRPQGPARGKHSGVGRCDGMG